VPAFSRQPDITISSVEMTDWQMLVEKWDGAHNFPRFTTTTASRRVRNGSRRR
jgi:hypothetical protein